MRSSAQQIADVSSSSNIKTPLPEAAEKAQWLRACAALAEDRPQFTSQHSQWTTKTDTLSIHELPTAMARTFMDTYT